jgi:hypothetical protein
MKMETPKKHHAHGMSNTLKQALSDENYLKALALFEKSQRNRLINRLYPEDYWHMTVYQQIIIMTDPTINSFNELRDIDPCDWDDINISDEDNYER